MTDKCGCCEGIEPVTPERVANRPGLGALRYRIGTHATFLETMLARLSSSDYPPLAGLGTRSSDDPAVALLDGWALVADVLTFYQERIANEGYLRTATERRSVLELARLVGYTPRPGVSASVYLAYTLDDKTKEPVVIPRGSRVQSVPGPGETAQTFETSEDLPARAEWSALRPRLRRPQLITLDNVLRIEHVYLEGVSTNLKPGDRLLFVFGDEPGQQAMRRVAKADADFQAGRTGVALQPVPLLSVMAAAALSALVAVPDARLAQPGTTAAERKKLMANRRSLLLLLENLYLGNYQAPRLDREFLELAPPPGVLFAAGLPWDLLGLGVRSTGRLARGALASLMPRFDDVPPAAAAGALRALARAIADPAVGREIACLGVALVDWARTPLVAGQLTGVREAVPGALSGLVESWTALQEGGQPDLLDAATELVAALRRLLAVAELRDALEAWAKDWYGTNPDEFPGVWQAWALLAAGPKGPPAGCAAAEDTVATLKELVGPLLAPPSVQPASARRLARDRAAILGHNADTLPQALVSLRPALSATFYGAWANARIAAPGVVKVSERRAAATPPRLPVQAVYALRLSAPPFGYNAAMKMGLKKNTNDGTVTTRPTAAEMPFIAEPDGDWDLANETVSRVSLDNAYDAVVANSYAVVQTAQGLTRAARVTAVETLSRTDYGISGKTTRLDLSRVWWAAQKPDMPVLRGTVVHTQSEELPLAEVPVENDIAGDRIVLGALYDGLDSGRWVIVAGERTDTPGTSGVRAAELAMIAAAEQVVEPDLPGDKAHTAVTLASALAYRYKRGTVTLYGNVVKATHGETRAEVLGSGDGSQALQSFTLKQPPLTYVAAANPSGVDSTLVVRVNDVQWHEAAGLAGLGPCDRRFIVKTDDDARTTVVFGNGRQGARLPTGAANVKATYRSGIGRGGNVRAGQLSLLMSRPLGVKEVTNPLPASGGADKESRDQARKNAPLAVMALDRLVSVRDYADFVRTFAGIAKAAAVRLSDGRREVVHVTIAGLDDIPIDVTSDLYRGLVQALAGAGDPYQPVQVDPRELLLLIVEARVLLHPEYAWEDWEPRIRAALLDRFSFEQSELGQDVRYADVVGCIQAVPAVAYVDLDALDAAGEEDVLDFLSLRPDQDLLAFLAARRQEQGEPSAVQPRKRIAVRPARPDASDGGIRPAQLAFLSPKVRDTLILKEITP